MIMPWSRCEIHTSVREIPLQNDRPIGGSKKAIERRHATSAVFAEALQRDDNGHEVHVRMRPFDPVTRSSDKIVASSASHQTARRVRIHREEPTGFDRDQGWIS
jgi:hypothetical protein